MRLPPGGAGDEALAVEDLEYSGHAPHLAVEAPRVVGGAAHPRRHRSPGTGGLVSFSSETEPGLLRRRGSWRGARDGLRRLAFRARAAGDGRATNEWRVEGEAKVPMDDEAGGSWRRQT